MHHPRSAAERVTLPREKGWRGVTDIRYVSHRFSSCGDISWKVEADMKSANCRRQRLQRGSRRNCKKRTFISWIWNTYTRWHQTRGWCEVDSFRRQVHTARINWWSMPKAQLNEWDDRAHYCEPSWKSLSRSAQCGWQDCSSTACSKTQLGQSICILQETARPGLSKIVTSICAGIVRSLRMSLSVPIDLIQV